VSHFPYFYFSGVRINWGGLENGETLLLVFEIWRLRVL